MPTPQGNYELAESMMPKILLTEEDEFGPWREYPEFDPEFPEQPVNTDGNWVTWKDRIRVLPGATESAASFQFEDEDHTLGNALRYILMKNPDIEFCGYSIPHPSENKMNLRIQTYDNVNVYEVLDKGLKDLIDLCDAVTEKFAEAREKFNTENGNTDRELVLSVEEPEDFWE